jgi:hypothetical protein
VSAKTNHFFTDLFLKPSQNGDRNKHDSHSQRNAEDGDPYNRMGKIGFVRRKDPGCNKTVSAQMRILFLFAKVSGKSVKSEK